MATITRAVGPASARASVDVKDYGAAGNDSGDDTTALQAALSAAGATVVGTRPSTVDGTTAVNICRSVRVPDGTYRISSGLTLPVGVDLELSRNAKIKATSSMAAMLTSSPTSLLQHQSIRGGIWDCNGLATVGLDLKYFANLRLTDISVWAPTTTGVLAGDAAATNPSYELLVHNLIVWRPKGVSVPSSSRGLWLRRATDCEVNGATLCGVDIGCQNDSGSNNFHSVHCWNYSGTGPTVAFADSASDGNYVQCTADSPTQYGWQFQLTSSGARLIACKAIMSTNTGTDNVTVALRADGTSPSLEIIGFITRGGSGSFRFASTFSGDFTGADILGLTEANVTTAADPNSFRGNANRSTLVLRNSSGTANVLEQKNNAGTITTSRLTSAGQLRTNQLGVIRQAQAVNYSVGTADAKLIAVTSTAAPRTITLPSAAALAAGDQVIVKDESGGAATNNITVARLGGDTFENGGASMTISTNYGVLRLYSDGVSRWFVI